MGHGDERTRAGNAVRHHIRPKAGIDAVKALRALLKRAWRSYELRCVDLREEPTTPTKVTEQREQTDEPN
jgi:hypothetical protein